MKETLYLRNRAGEFNAVCEMGDNEFVVKKGSKIRLAVASHIKGGTFANKYRNNKECVDENGILLKDCKFSSASTAAQFVTGRSTNGLMVWKTKDNKKLKEIM